MTLQDALNLAQQHHEAGNAAEAENIYRQILAQHPTQFDALENLGGLLHERGELDQAADCYWRMIAIQPLSPMGHVRVGLMLLARGDLKRGFDEFEWRWKMPELASVLRQLGKPMWNGGDLRGKRILVHAERGLGDTINFVRYLPMVAGRGGKVIFACHPDLHGLFAKLEGVDDWVKPGAPLPQFDVHCSLVSLPAVMGTTLATIPAKIPYIKTDDSLVQRWLDRLGADERLKVGLVWSGHDRSLGRAMTLAEMAPLAEANNVRFISLQKGSAATQAQSPPGGMEITDWTAELKDFSDTAALVENMDLVITVDTSVAHLAGAMGKRVWIALKRAPDWRWFVDRADSPWYPTARLFRQPRQGDWKTPVAEMAKILRNGKRELL
jgi:hypothetical protein